MVPRYHHIPKFINPNRKNESGSAILAALGVVVALILISAFVLTFAKDKYSSTSQSSSYQESLYAAEAGIDIARTALRLALSDPTTAWTGWTPSDGTTFPKTRTYTLPVLDTGTPVDITRPWGSKIAITVSLPTGTDTINPVNTSGLSYKVTSVGTVGVSGTANVTRDSSETRLHRVSYQKDWRTNTAVTSPEVSRKVEAILKPVSPFVGAVVADDNIEIKKGKTEVVDSFNSDLGKYDPSKRLTTLTGTAPAIANAGWNGTLATNAKKADVIRVENAIVYGDAYKNTGGTINIKSTATLTGTVHDGFYMDLKQAPSPRTSPDWSSYSTMSAAPGSKATSITASSSSTSPARFKYTKLHLHDNDILTIKSPSGGASASWAEIWCSDSLRLHKGGKIIIEKGVRVKFFCEKCIHLESKDGKAAVIRYQNQNPDPDMFVPTISGGVATRANEYAEFYGVLPDAKKESHLKITGQFAGVVHAPRHEAECKLNDSANNDVYASFIVRKFKMQGVTQVHYDEHMANLGTVTDYAVSNWNEDWTDKKVSN